MPQDYNIYLHAVNTGGNYNPTTPWSQRDGGDSAGAAQTASATGGGGVNAGGLLRATMMAASYVQNPDSIVSKAVSNIAKAIPIVGIAIAVVEAAVAITDNAIEFSELESGDHRGSAGWSNFKAGVGIALHPVSSTVQHFKTENQWRIENERRRAQRDLLGDSVINSYKGRGV